MGVYAFLISGEHPALAVAECRSVTPLGDEWQRRGRLVLCRSSQSPLWERLAFTRSGYEVLFRGGFQELKQWVRDHPVRCDGSVRVERVVISGGAGVSSEDARRLVLGWLGHPRVNLSSPDKVFVLVVSGDEYLLCEECWRNEEDFESRKPHRRPAPHPTGLHPKLARAMVNLSGARSEVLDPFCGAGGILLEAGLMGLSVRGVDIDPLMVKRAVINLSSAGIDADVVVGDALLYDVPAEAVVTDLPYGKNSKASDLESLYSSFLIHARTLTKSLVIAFPSLVPSDEFVARSGWVVKERFSWFLHRSLEKHIFVLSLKE